jgi:hypothetical protein
MSFAITQAVFIHRIVTIVANVFFSFLFEVPTLEDALLPHISIDLLHGRKVA